MKMSKRALTVTALLFAVACFLRLNAQLIQPPQAQQTATMANAATKVTNMNTAVNAAQTTITLAPAGTNYVYVTGVDMAICGDTTGTAQSTVAFSWTGGIVPSGTIPIWAYSTAINPSVCTFKVLNYATPLKSISPGTAVTLQSPAQAAHTGYEANVYWYEAP